MRNILSRMTYRLASFAKRARAASSFLRGTMTEDDAYLLLRDVQETLGSWCIVSIETRMVLDRLRDTYVDQPEFPRFARDAAQRVYFKWPGDDSEFTSSIVDWAQDLAEGYARGEGVPLIAFDEEEGDVAA